MQEVFHTSRSVEYLLLPFTLWFLLAVHASLQDMEVGRKNHSMWSGEQVLDTPGNVEISLSALCRNIPAPSFWRVTYHAVSITVALDFIMC